MTINQSDNQSIHKKGPVVRVLLLSPLPPPNGGIATWTSVVLEALKHSQEIQLRHLDTAVRWRHLAERRMLIRITGASLKAMWELVHLAFALLRQRPNVVHLCSSAGPAAMRDVIVLAFCRLAFARTILHLHTSCLPLDQSRDGIVWMASKAAITMADNLIVLERQTEALVHQLFPRKQVYRLANPLDVDSISSSEGVKENSASGVDRNQEGCLKLVFVGHVVKEKGVELLVRAASRNTRISINIVGPMLKEYGDRLMQIAKMREDGRWLSFTGEVSRTRVQAEISSADVVALPSLRVYEAFPYAVLEGMAHAKPILASNVGAIPDMLGVGMDDIAGICLEPGNEQQLESAMKHLLHNPDERKRMGINGQRRVRTMFDTSLITKQLVQIWMSVS